MGVIQEATEERIREERAGSSCSSSCAACISQKGVVCSLPQERGSGVWDRWKMVTALFTVLSSHFPLYGSYYCCMPSYFVALGEHNEPSFGTPHAQSSCVSIWNISIFFLWWMLCGNSCLGHLNPSGDQRALAGKIACVMLFSFSLISMEGFAGLRAVCVDYRLQLCKRVSREKVLSWYFWWVLFWFLF